MSEFSLKTINARQRSRNLSDLGLCASLRVPNLRVQGNKRLDEPIEKNLRIYRGKIWHLYPTPYLFSLPRQSETVIQRNGIDNSIVLIEKSVYQSQVSSYRLFFILFVL